MLIYIVLKSLFENINFRNFYWVDGIVFIFFLWFYKIDLKENCNIIILFYIIYLLRICDVELYKWEIEF